MNQERLLQVILSQHVSEKSAINTEKNNEYVFKVLKNATKTEVKSAIELLFSTKVKNVHMVNIKAKQKNFKGVSGTRKSFKKAYVTLLPDQKLETGVQA